MFWKRNCFALAAATLTTFAQTATADDHLIVALGQRGNWESSAPELGLRAGIFRKHHLDLEILWTQGGGETQLAVISGSVDVGHGIGVAGVMSAYAKGAPVRVVANATTGADDLYWYVPSGSPIHSLKDAAGKTIAYSTTGSSTHMIVLGFNKYLNVGAKPTATGNGASTFTQTMSGQVDIGWGSPLIATETLEQGKLRVIATGSEIPSLRDQTVRVQIVTPQTLATRADAIRNYVAAYGETLDWMYSDPAGLKAYAGWANVSEAFAKRIRDEFYPKRNLVPERLSGLDAAMADAIDLKFLTVPLSNRQIDELFGFMLPTTNAK